MRFISTFTFQLLFFICVIRYRSPFYPSGEKYSWEAQALGLCLSAVSILAVPGWALHFLFVSKHDQLKPMEVGGFSRGIDKGNRFIFRDFERAFIRRTSPNTWINRNLKSHHTLARRHYRNPSPPIEVANYK
jgi:hypothetical protein